MRQQRKNTLASADWDFRGADTKPMTHGLHPYPAMMIPQIAGRLIDRYGARAKILFDPYCGTGSSLLEANIHGIDAVGTDLNPLARMIARAKTVRLDCQKMDLYLRHVNERLFKERFSGGKTPAPPPIKNINFWFSKKVQRELAVVRAVIDEIEDADARRFLLVGFSETVRECSYTRNGEFKLYRMKAEQMEKFSPDVFGVFMAKLTRNFSAMKEYVSSVKKVGKTKVYDFNTVDGIPAKNLPPEKTDIVVTSPPYGDSRTTVAYGQFSRLANEWLGYEDASAVDNRLMGGKNGGRYAQEKDSNSLGCGKLEDAIECVEKASVARAREIRNFYRDYRRSIANVAASIKAGGFACYVVGNRKSKGVVLPTDEATRAYFKESGFRQAGVFVRNIPNKRMPAKNSPSNVVGDCDATMTQEHIIVMKKRA